ncbi:flagellar filament capping protein FliD [Clostridium fallax]|uniref:Flagellar hook-associated protein 2 n=1 Tax=Clostridium fallax TaxID=1533 RepID=A0A1M4ULN3_9CLOT|nr:flagellar filament capping protein FliD [Clostridium fallax]SHE57568.1 flagellar hook-associated protein 2 [Clostridium fallax]SQB07631.1 flagellar cap protein fliD [Clostridium fallax]
MNINGASNSGGSYNRITGMATGMDTDNMVKQMLSRDRARVDKVKQDEQALKWKQEAYVDITKDLKELNDYFDITNPNGLFKSENYSGFKCNSSDENSVTAKAFGGAAKGKYKVEVNQLATGAKAEITLNSSSISNLSSSTKLKDLGITKTDLTLKIKDKEFNIKIDTSKDIEDLVSKIKYAKNGDTILGNLVDVHFSELTGKLTIETKETGENAKLEITNDIFNGTKLEQGKNAEFKITPPGEKKAYTKTSYKNTLLVDNISFTANEVTTSEVSINVIPDATDQVKKFKGFIDKYNSILDKINDKLSEKKEYKFKPLTEEQKKEMKEDEIKNWEEKAKKGLVKGDMQLSTLMSSIRGAFYKSVEGAGLTLTDIGISTSGNYRDRGKLELDENKFKEALETRGDQVQKLFTAYDKPFQYDKTKSQKENNDMLKSHNEKIGIFTQIKEQLETAIGKDGFLIKKAGYKNTRWITNNDLSKKIQDKAKLIRELEAKIFTKQEQLYKKFAILEKNMNNMNSQSSWLSQQFAQ